MAKQVFTASQVLTAAQQNSLQSNDYNQTVSTKTASYTLVAADAGTRVVMNAAGATTITVNTSLFSAGDTLVLQNIGAGTCTVTAGTATVSSAGPLAIPQYGSGTLYFTSTGVSIYFPSAVTASAGAMTLITGADFSAQTSVAFANSTFTSTYDYYLVMLDAAGDAADTNLSLQVRDNGGTKSTAAYFGGGIGQLANNTQSTFGVNGATSFALMQTTSATGRNRCGWTIFVSSPASTTKATIWNGTATANPQTGASIGGWHFGGEYGVEEAHTGLVFTFSAASSGLYRVYGLANS